MLYTDIKVNIRTNDILTTITSENITLYIILSAKYKDTIFDGIFTHNHFIFNTHIPPLSFYFL